MTEPPTRGLRPPAATAVREPTAVREATTPGDLTTVRGVLQVRVRARDARTAGPGPSSADPLVHAWSCVQTFATADSVLLGAAGPGAPDPARLVAEGLAVAAELAAAGVGDDLVVLVSRGRPDAFAAATRSARLRVVLVDDAPARPADLRPWTGCLDGHAVVVTEPGQLAGAVCEALVHDGPALVHVAPAG